MSEQSKQIASLEVKVIALSNAIIDYEDERSSPQPDDELVNQLRIAMVRLAWQEASP